MILVTVLGWGLGRRRRRRRRRCRGLGRRRSGVVDDSSAIQVRHPSADLVGQLDRSADVLVSAPNSGRNLRLRGLPATGPAVDRLVLAVHSLHDGGLHDGVERHF